ncbi:hypothetical protein KSX_43540 [Ktedonospora formicarum]|uniref:Uncharacterized protein n=1 Tax=Ktedonospora formicarum TaxID=2778364 RepID=A0A8J3HZT1_9CHLR|nr:hypothetical protein KSX_43540 [Ktedonospora formicarum]
MYKSRIQFMQQLSLVKCWFYPGEMMIVNEVFTFFALLMEAFVGGDGKELGNASIIEFGVGLLGEGRDN